MLNTVLGRKLEVQDRYRKHLASERAKNDEELLAKLVECKVGESHN